jgi:opacity protein-like surface antigen
MRSRSILPSIAAALVILGSGTISAQGAGAGAGRPFHALVLSTGVSTMSVDALNARMTTSQFAPLSNDAVSFGASGHVAIGRALVGAELARLAFGEEGLNNGRTDELTALQGIATIGYALVSTERLSLFPQLGVGMGRVEVSLRDRVGPGTTTSQPTFDEVAQAPGAESRVAGRHLLYSFGGGADYLVSRAGASVGVVLGVRAGMLASPNRTTWTRNGQTVIAGPDVAAAGPFVRVVVGVGAR